MDFNFEQCTGNGLGECRRCADKGKWNRYWVDFLYKVDGFKGVYCWNCVKELRSMCEREDGNEQERT